VKVEISETKEVDFIPLVLLHGFGGGLALWTKNFEPLCKDLPLYAIDILGFGRSSRPAFAGDHKAAEQFWIDSLEAWRKKMGFSRMVLLGHSMGGYISTIYALAYPQHVEKLILLSPFGVIQRERRLGNLPLKWKAVKAVVSKSSPQVMLRLAGPLGPTLLYRFRGRYDSRRYEFDDNRVPEYVYHLTAGPAGSGDYAFMSLVDSDGRIRNPLSERVEGLTMPLTIIYGSHDTITGSNFDVVRQKVKDCTINEIKAGDHHVYATKADDFHQHVLISIRPVVDKVAQQRLVEESSRILHPEA